MSSTDTDPPPATPAAETPPKPSKAKKAKAAKEEHDVPEHLFGASVVYTPTTSEAETLLRTRAITQKDFAAIVTSVDGATAGLFVLPSVGEPFRVMGATQGEREPHTFRLSF